MNPGDAGHRRQLFDDKALQIAAIADDDLEQIIIFARHVMTFQYLFHTGDRAAKLLNTGRRMKLQADMNKTEHIIAQPFPVQVSGISRYEALPLQLA